MKAFFQVLEAAIAVRDHYTVNHQRRVTQIACTIGVELELSEERLRSLRRAGTLHALGKIAVPTDLLAKSESSSPWNSTCSRPIRNAVRSRVIRRPSAISAWPSREDRRGGLSVV